MYDIPQWDAFLSNSIGFKFHFFLKNTQKVLCNNNKTKEVKERDIY